MINEYREVCGMRIGRGNGSTRRKPDGDIFPNKKTHVRSWD
jgi:hypothetical protein